MGSYHSVLVLEAEEQTGTAAVALGGAAEDQKEEKLL
jgi:hypothetical protein